MAALIIELLRQKIGLDSTAIGTFPVLAAIKQRMAAVNITNEQSYYDYLTRSAEELQALIEAVVVPETWFYRDREPFLFLQGFVQKNHLQRRHLPWRILSLPCSTGEEPYSIAIALLEAGLLPYQFTIDAVDVSYRALEKAKTGIYTKNSFRGTDPQLIDLYFTVVNDSYQLLDQVKKQVNFQYGNILQFQRVNYYDIIFCRNLLIYLDRESRGKALHNLHKAMTNDGLLFVGHSEVGCLTESNFVLGGSVKAFVFRKLSPQLPSPAISTPLLPPPPIPSPAVTTPQLLEEARRKADQNELKAALSLCQTYLQNHPLDENAHTLLGEIYQAQGNPQQAIECYQKALYINPHHYPALVHLLLLKQQSGDAEGVKVLQQRIDRLAKEKM
ncbi:MAG: CheR family methyltransferase [Pseudanabaenaceae cyanobacterium SKYGB_i_bin29]|nr:tetratricopeptide repeat protein [Pseudanabaenaceae cyanobacterium SKYG29]MDW8421133.1 CheR family methyltransferase [Pseudanabaenaceae cyanobacterium SKYGB_i_bin29]